MESKDNTIQIVEAKPDMFELISEIQNNDGFEHSYPLSRERITKLIHRGECFYLAYYDGETAGMISVDFEIRAKLHFFSIKQDYHGKGIGTALLTKVLEEARNSNYSSVYVYVEQDSPVEKFLLRRGFNKVGYYHNRYKNRRSADILEIGF